RRAPLRPRLGDSRPAAALFMRAHGSINERHDADAVGYAWNAFEVVLEGHAEPMRDYGLGKVAIEIGKSQGVAFGMPRAEAGCLARILGEIVITARKTDCRPADRLEPENFRLLLHPGQAAALAEDAEPQPVVVPRGDVAAPDAPAGAIVKTRGDEGVVVNLPPRPEGLGRR